MIIEKIGSQHLCYVASVIRDRWNVSSIKAMSEVNRWMLQDDHSVCFVGLVRDIPVAFAVFDVQSNVDPSITSWNRQLWVEPAHRGHRYGYALTVERFRWARSKGYDCVYLSTETAKDYHLKHGWQVVREENKDDRTITIMKYDLKDS